MNTEWAGQEKRRFPRAQFPCKIVMYLPSEHTIITHTENIGCGGVKVILEEEIQVSSEVRLELFIDKSRAIQCKGKVIWQVPIKNPLLESRSFFDVGLEFIDIASSDSALVSKLVESLIKE